MKVVNNTGVRNIRNFWIDCAIDGRRTQLHSGPKTRDGGMEIDIIQREYHNGEKTFEKVLEIHCVEDNGILKTIVYARDCNGHIEEIFNYETKRDYK